MKLGNITDYSARQLKGHRLDAALIVLLLTGSVLFFRAAEASVLSLMLYFGYTCPAELFIGKTPLQYAVSFAFTAMRYTAEAPLMYTAACRFTGITTASRTLSETPVSAVLTDGRLFRRSLLSLLCSKAAGILFMLPAVFFGYTAFSFFIGGGSAAALFMGLHSAVMTLVSAGLWIWAKTALLALPFLMVRLPEKSIPALTAYCFRFMKGRRGVILKLSAYYGFRLIPVVTIPSVLPQLFSAVSLCIDIFIKEDEYREGYCTGGHCGKTADASKLSPRTKGRFKTPSDKAQTAG